MTLSTFWKLRAGGESSEYPHSDVTLTDSRSYIPVVYCLNKIDSISIEELDLLYRIPHAVPISSEHGWNVDELMEAMWDKLQLKRVYTKPKGKAPDYTAPVVLRRNRCTVEDFVSVPQFPARAHPAHPPNTKEIPRLRHSIQFAV